MSRLPKVVVTTGNTMMAPMIENEVIQMGEKFTTEAK